MVNKWVSKRHSHTKDPPLRRGARRPEYRDETEVWCVNLGYL